MSCCKGLQCAGSRNTPHLLDACLTSRASCGWQVLGAKQRYEVGLEKLAFTESSVATMQQELIALQPQLEASTVETETAMTVGASLLLPCEGIWKQWPAPAFPSLVLMLGISS